MSNSKAREIGKFDPRHYEMLGFRDYQAARCLLLNELLISGATLASTCLEKYLKCFLSIRGISKPIHLDRVEQMSEMLAAEGIDVLSGIDPVFLSTLSTAYRLRYYDAHDGLVFGVHQWQLLAELDSVIFNLNSRIDVRFSTGESLPTEYRAAIDKNDQSICRENHVLDGTSKKEYMERMGPGVVLRVDKSDGETMMTFKAKFPNYSGAMFQAEEFEIKGRS